MTATIPLAKTNKVALIDAEDLAKVAGFKWRIVNEPPCEYAAARLNGKTVKLHQLIISAPPGFEIDHCSGDTLDNRKENLRIATHQQNMWNRRKAKSIKRKFKSAFKGVSASRNGKWRARIECNGKLLNLGTFEKEQDAARCYDAKAMELFGLFAKPNFERPMEADRPDLDSPMMDQPSLFSCPNSSGNSLSSS